MTILFQLLLDPLGCCRWSTYADEPLISVKSHMRYLRILDVWKKEPILKSPIELESDKISAANIYFTSSLSTFPLDMRFNFQPIKERIIVLGYATS